VRARLALTALLALCACPKDAPTEPVLKEAPPTLPKRAEEPPVPPDDGEAASDAGSLRARYPTPAGVLVLDDKKIEEFIAYQAGMVAHSGAFSDRVTQLEAGHDGGQIDAKTLDQSVNLLHEEREARQEILQSAGLSRTDLDAVEKMVSDFLADRNAAQALGQDAMMEQLEEVARQMPADRRTPFNTVIREARERRDAARSLITLRARYGDANVERLLAHETELQAALTQTAATLHGPAPKRGP
jgi:hypothetical protein